MAYFNKIMNLKEITDHIYGRSNIITRTDRPNMFIKELSIYIDYLKNKLEETKGAVDKKQQKYLTTFAKNLKEGVSYYQQVFGNLKTVFKDTKPKILSELNKSKLDLLEINQEINSL